MSTAVLVVEDDDDLRMALRELLLDEGYSVLEAEDGGIALDRLRATTERMIVLLGLDMPRLGGADVLRQVAGEPALAQGRRFIMLTASIVCATMGAVRALRDQLGVPLIAKPFDCDELLLAVARAARQLT